MSVLDWLVLSVYFTLMIALGLWAQRRVKNANDYFAAGGTMPWWLSGISHHVSGYSTAAFVGYAAIAYSYGLTIYVWWACTIALAMVIGVKIFPPRWSRLRQKTGMISPLEYLLTRYNLATQQVLAWSGAGLKVFDIGAKWTATAVLLNVFGGVPLVWGVLLTGGVTLVYAVAGGLWANAVTNLSQFGIQLVTGFIMLGMVCARLGGVSSLWTVWHRLPAGNSHAFNGPYTPLFALAFLLINTLSYNGGTWNLAQRFIASPSGRSAQKAAMLSAALYLIWPLALFFPVWAAPVLLPHMVDPSQSYALVAKLLLPRGLVGLVLGGLFTATMAMTSSDANAVAAVIVRDIVPALRRGHTELSGKAQLAVGELSVFLLLAVSMVIAIYADHFGGVLGLLILWFAALLGPNTVPMLLGMLWPLRRSGSAAALISWGGGVATFVLLHFAFADAVTRHYGQTASAVNVGAPLAVSLILFVVVGWMTPNVKPEAAEMLLSIRTDAVAGE
jgi:SSS family solute:Na+ symporter